MSANGLRLFLSYGATALLGPRGFLVYNPFLFIAIPYLVGELRPGRPFRREAAAVASAAVVIVTYYLLYTNNYGGWSYSVRWFVPLLPLVFFFLHPFLAAWDGRRRAMFTALFGVATLISSIGLVNPWSAPVLSDVPLIANLREIPFLLAQLK
jgi:hypothetical protein